MIFVAAIFGLAVNALAAIVTLVFSALLRRNLTEFSVVSRGTIAVYLGIRVLVTVKVLKVIVQAGTAAELANSAIFTVNVVTGVGWCPSLALFEFTVGSFKLLTAVARCIGFIISDKKKQREKQPI